MFLHADGSYKSNQEASDILAEILKNVPHKPMKSVSHGGHSFNQLPIPDDVLPPFKPLSNYPSQYESSLYGTPSDSYSAYSHQSTNTKTVAVSNPKVSDIYRSMRHKMTKEKNFVTLPTIDNSKNNKHGLEIQKSIEYEIKA
jgi:hypothetical protein